MRRSLAHFLLMAVFGLTLSLVPPAEAGLVTVSANPNQVIPDNDRNGVASTLAVTAPFNSVASVTVTLQLTGGYTGDFYAYLRHGASGFAVLLNHVGQTGANGFGAFDSGFDVILSDLAPNGDIHHYANLVNPAGGTLTGLWQPDGRRDSASSDRPEMLSNFKGMDPNGDWTLFVADLSPIGEGTLASWSLSIEGPPSPRGVPDTGSTLPLAAATLLLFAGFKVGPLGRGPTR